MQQDVRSTRRSTKRKRKPFELTLDDPDALAIDLARVIDEALAVRSVSDGEIEYFHTLYEQGRTRTGSQSPWQDAADLTSYLGTMYVDVLRSQIVQTVMTDPVWTVEGYGAAAANAPFVEEFHQWQQEAEGFQGVFARAVHLALIEPYGVIEVYEDTITRVVRKVIRAAYQLAPDGTALVNAALEPTLLRNARGAYVEVVDEQIPSAEVEIDSTETVCRGPRMRVIATRDFLILPGHATDKSEVWGYGKRFFRRIEDLQDRARAGHYDIDAVDALGTDDERPSETTLAGTALGVSAKDTPTTAEKELWELLILKDLDGTGPRWFVVTLHKDKKQILRVQYDDIGQPRFFPLVPFPRPNSLEGYSYIGHKLITVIEEHTAWRNMLADRAALQLQAPIKLLTGALWDPDTEPIGPKSIITVRDMREVEPMQFPDATGPAIERIRDAERAGERLSGINDAAAGVTSETSRTLGEVELITQQSMGRTAEAVKNILETLEEIAQVRHLLWKRALAELGREGMEAPPSVFQNLNLRQTQIPMLPSGPPTQTLMGLEGRAPDVQKMSPPQSVRFTAQMMEGTFRFKPHGSVENADRNRQRYDFNQSMLAIGSLSQSNPMIGYILRTPQASKALLEQWAKLFNVPDKQAFLGSEALTAAMQQMQAAQLMGAAGGAGTPPGPTSAGTPPPPSPPGGVT